MFDSNPTMQDYESGKINYNKIKVGVKSLDNAVLNLDFLHSSIPDSARITKGGVYQAIIQND